MLIRKKSLDFAYESIKSLTVRVDAQAKTISELEMPGCEQVRWQKVPALRRNGAIKLESHSRRSNLIFCGISPEEVNETSPMTESLLYSFLRWKRIEELTLSNARILAERSPEFHKISPERIGKSLVKVLKKKRRKKSATPNRSTTSYTSTVRDTCHASYYENFLSFLALKNFSVFGFRCPSLEG